MLEKRPEDQRKLKGSMKENTEMVEELDEMPLRKDPKTIEIKDTPFSRILGENNQPTKSHVALEFNQNASIENSLDSEEIKHSVLEDEEEEKALDERPEIFSEMRLRPDFGKLSLKELDELYPQSICTYTYESLRKSRKSSHKSQSRSQDLGTVTKFDNELREKPKPHTIIDIVVPDDKDEPQPEEEKKSSSEGNHDQSIVSQRSKKSHVSHKSQVSQINLAISRKDSSQAKQVKEDKSGNIPSKKNH